MSYIRFALMILTSTVVMFILMYLNTYASEHVFFSETRAYMAVLMGATMAVVMLAFMLGMYSSKALNLAIFAAATVVFALSLWLVRSQVTVSGTSYMRAMIPHHSIAVMTSERARIEDPRVAKLAHEIVLAQRREIAEMRYLIAEISEGNTVGTVYRDPEAEVGTVEDALGRVLISSLEPAPMPPDEADAILDPGPRCAFNRSPETDAVLWVSQDGGRAAMKLNGVLLPLAGGEQGGGTLSFRADGVAMTLRPLGDDASWRSDAELVFALDEGLTVGYRGFYTCEGG